MISMRVFKKTNLNYIQPQVQPPTKQFRPQCQPPPTKFLVSGSAPSPPPARKILGSPMDEAMLLLHLHALKARTGKTLLPSSLTL